ncbi:MAG TPA: hypothetical protein VIH61_10070 [Waddliaceae bacterium]
MKKSFFDFFLCTLSVMISNVTAGYCVCEDLAPGCEQNYYCPPDIRCGCFYLGLEGGWDSEISTANRAAHVGAFGDGVAFNSRARVGYEVGVNFGYIFNSWLRADLSYTFLNNKHEWEAQFPSNNVTIGEGAIEFFDGRLHTHLALLNLYARLGELYPIAGFRFAPYITGGLGVAMNDFHDIKERVNLSAVLATALGSDTLALGSDIQAHTKTNFGGRFGLGILKFCSKNWIWDLGFNVNYIGEVRSGNSRKTVFLVPGVTPIHPYRFHHNWIAMLYLGLKYALPIIDVDRVGIWKGRTG